MKYTSYNQIVRDVNYLDEMDPRSRRNDYMLYRHEEPVDYRIVGTIKKLWLEHVKDNYEEARQGKSSLGLFLRKYPLDFREFCCLIDLLNDTNNKSDFEIENRITESKDLFKKNKVRFESSRLKRLKLVYKVTDPMRPLKVVYIVSYSAQLALKNQKYTDEYEQLDLMLEEESKRNTPDQLNSLYYIIEPKERFNDLIVNKDIMERLDAALSRELGKDKIFRKWGFDKVLQYGKGTTINFRGPPGTGKTLAANCLANRLNRKLLMVRYDQLQNMYVGETEKHIQQVFKMAKMKNAVLFFDEADAIALDRASLERSWEMSQVNTLLKELERFDGVCIFATNFAEKYDPAFDRRLTMHIDFTLPNNKQCQAILDKLLPKRSRDKSLTIQGLDIEGLSGGDIKNVVLNAAGIAVKEVAEKICRKHIEEAIKIVKSANTCKDKAETRYIA